MADRTVKVRLELDKEGLSQGLRAEAAELRAFDAEVQSLGDRASRTGVEMKSAGEDIKSAGEEIKAIGRASVPTTDQVKKLGDEAKTTGEHVVSAGSRLETLTAALHNVDAEIERSKTLLGELAQEFGRTGDSSIVSKFSGTNSALSGLVKFRTELEKLKADAERATKGIGANAQGGFLNFALDEWVSKVAQSTRTGVMSGLNALSGTAPTGFVGWLVAGAVAASPAIGAAINAGVLLGLGGIGVAGGLALAAQSPQVRGAYVDLGQFAKQQLTLAASGFVDPSLVAIDKVKTTLGGLSGALKADFDAVAPSVANLADGIDGFITNLQNNGLGKAFEEARPVLDAFAQELPGIGSAMGAFFQHIADGGPGAIQFIHDFSAGLDVTLENVGLLVEGLSKTYDFVRNNPWGQLLSPASEFFNMASEGPKKGQKSLADYNAEGYRSVQMLGEVSQGAQSAGLGITLAADDFKSLATQIAATKTTSDVLAGAMSDKLFGSMMAMDRATLGVATAQTALGDSFKQNTVSARNHAVQLDIATAAGQANRAAVLNVVAANIAQYDAQIKSGISAQDAAAAYDQNTGALVKQMRQAGLTQGQIDGLIGKYRSVPDTVDTNIVLKGLADAISGLDATLRKINGLDGKTASVYVTTYYRSNGTPAAGAPGGLGASQKLAFAEGGVVAAAQGLITSSPTVLFGERGTVEEAYIPRAGISDARGLALADTAASWHGGRVVPAARAGGGVTNYITIPVTAGMGTDGEALGRQIAAALKPYVNSAGGGNVQAALGRRGQ